MPSSKNYKRDYKREYKVSHSSPAERKKRSNRNKARRKAIKKGGSVSGKDVHHKNGNANDNKSSNLAVISKSKNRSFKRNKKAGKTK